jgi:hypothetical protein
LQGCDDYILSYVSLYVSRVGSKSHSFCTIEDVHQLRAHKIEQQFDYEHHDDATSSVITLGDDVLVVCGVIAITLGEDVADWWGGQCNLCDVGLTMSGLASLSESESEMIGCGGVGLVCASSGRPGGGLVFGIVVGVAWMILGSQVRSASCDSFRCVAAVLDMRTLDRFAVAAMMASAGVTVGLVMYLCLKNTFSEMHVVRETGVHNFGQL